MKDEKFTINDLTELRRIFSTLKKVSQPKSALTQANPTDKFKVQHMRSAVATTKKPLLKKAFEEMVNLLDEEQKNGVIDSEIFSNCISHLE